MLVDYQDGSASAVFFSGACRFSFLMEFE